MEEDCKHVITKITVISNADLIKGEHESEKIKEALSSDDFYEKLLYYYKNFEALLGIRAGDVYLAQFPNRVGSEMSGDHFVVAIINSRKKDPNVMVIPLTSAKEGKAKNTRNSVYLGTIPGINNGKESIALINLVQSIDKKRLLKMHEVEKTLSLAAAKTHNRSDVIQEIYKVHYRLTPEQFNTLVKGCKKFMRHNTQLGTKA